MKNLILLIPGNPSVPGIYDPFLNQVVTDLKLKGETVHKVLPHLGQCNQVVVNYKRITVRDVIEDHRKTIKNHDFSRTNYFIFYPIPLSF